MENLTSKTRSRVPLILITEGLFTHCPIEPRLIMMMLIRLLDCLRVVGLLSELRLMSLGLSQWKVGMWRIGKREISKDVEKNGKPQIVVLFFQKYEEKMYAELKRFMTKELKIPSQVVRRRTLSNQQPARNMSAASKIILQMNAKLGMPLW